MNLTKDKIKSLWKKRNTIYSSNKEIVDRFNIINKTIDELLSLNVDDIRKKDDEKIKMEPFGPAKNSLAKDHAFEGVIAQSEEFDEKDYKDLIIKTGSILGGFDFESHRMIDKYRILSNTIIKEDDFEGSLNSNIQGRHPSSHFADNNYFFAIAKFLQDCKDDEKYPFENTPIVLRYYDHYFGEKGDKNQAKKQQEVLKYRFPPKFLWMWAKKDEVLHPISLMAFREFLKTEYAKEILKSIDENLTPKSLTNMKFDEFKEKWKEISNKIIEDFKEEANDKYNLIEELSKFFSIISIKETDIKNISDLLQTGNKAVILWGPPGTGKTYESEQVVKELLNIGDDNLEDYLFSTNTQNEKGYYEIIQFHPNYGYEDFIGGISPKLNKNNNSLGYELRKGIFKRFCDAANKVKNANLKYIFIIDEINRAELSAVFGELLYALEYRGKSINLPHFGKFSIPENVYIIGTMNNVDKSLVSFDLALRRRFGFFKLMPKLEVIQEVLSNVIEKDSLDKFYDKAVNLNKQITEELNLTEDYQIGQAYFLKIKDFLPQPQEEYEITSFELEKLWIYHIEPLLEEYLGMSVEDDEIKNKLNKLKEEFLKDVS